MDLSYWKDSKMGAISVNMFDQDAYRGMYLRKLVMLWCKVRKQRGSDSREFSIIIKVYRH